MWKCNFSRFLDLLIGSEDIRFSGRNDDLVYWPCIAPGAPDCARIDDLHKTVFCYSVFDRPPDLKFGRITRCPVGGGVKEVS